jgi:hypothetical protein
MRQEVATNIAYAWGAVRQRELFDAEDQANAVREREDDFQKAEVA